MEIRKLCLYVVLNCAVIVPYLTAKPFSLNEALAEESSQTTFNTTPSSFAKDSAAHRFSLNKALTSENSNNLRKPKLEYTTRKVPISEYKKTHHYSLLEPNKLRQFLKPLELRRTIFKKREILQNNDRSDRKYISLIKNLGLLLSNLLNSEPIDSYEIRKKKYQHYKYQPQGRSGMVCKCALETNSETKESGPPKKTTIFARTHPIKTTASTSKTVNSSLGQHSDQGQIKNIPLLLARDSRSDRRDGNGHSERDRATFYRNYQRNIAGDIRDRKYFPGNEKEHSTSIYAKTSYSHPRDGTSSNEYKRRLNRGNPVSIDRNTTIEGKENEKSNVVYGRVSSEDVSGDDKLKIERNESKRQKLIPKYVRRFGRVVSANKESDITKPIQPQEDCKESFQDITYTNTNDKQITNGNGPISTKASRVSSNEQMISIEDLSNLNLALRKDNKLSLPPVSIIDGYSVTRNKNGQYKSI